MIAKQISKMMHTLVLLFAVLCVLSASANSPPATPAPATSPANPEVMTLADADRALQSGDLKQAIVVHEALLQKHGPQADLYYNLGLLYGASEDWALSVLNLERAQTLDPDALDIKPHLTAAKEALGKSVLAAHADRKITQGEPKVFAMWRFFGVVGPQTAGVILLSAWLLGFRGADRAAVREGGRLARRVDGGRGAGLADGGRDGRICGRAISDTRRATRDGFEGQPPALQRTHEEREHRTPRRRVPWGGGAGAV
jgi:hypothetical protein